MEKEKEEEEGHYLGPEGVGRKKEQVIFFYYMARVHTNDPIASRSESRR